VLARLGLVRVAPTVLAGTASPAATLTALRKAGYLPVETDHDGTRVVEIRSRGPRGQLAADATPGDGEEDEPAGARHTGSSVWPSKAEINDELETFLAQLQSTGAAHGPGRDTAPREPEDLTTLVARLRAGRAPEGAMASDEVVQAIELWAPHLRPDEVLHLATAVERGDDVHIRYRSQSGGHSERRVSGLRVLNGYLFGYCHLRRDQRHFRLDRILGVFPAQ
jgi:hypothetical protein